MSPTVVGATAPGSRVAVLAELGRDAAAPRCILGRMGTSADSPRLVGREDELGRLEAALEAAEAGGATRVVLVGEAGVGKSRLLTELAARARDRGVLVLRGAASGPGGTSTPYAGIAEALRDHLDRPRPAESDDPLAPLAPVPGPRRAPPPTLETGSSPQGPL